MQKCKREVASEPILFANKYESYKTRDIYVNIANQKRAIIILQSKMDTKRVYPIPNKKFKKGSGNQSYSSAYELNVRAIVSVFYIRTGSFDIGVLVRMFGLLGGTGWEHQHSRYTALLNDIIIDLVEKMMKESICRNIDGTIKDKVEEKG